MYGVDTRFGKEVGMVLRGFLWYLDKFKTTMVILGGRGRAFVRVTRDDREPPKRERFLQSA